MGPCLRRGDGNGGAGLKAAVVCQPIVIPAQAGIQTRRSVARDAPEAFLDSRLRGNDDGVRPTVSWR